MITIFNVKLDMLNVIPPIIPMILFTLVSISLNILT